MSVKQDRYFVIVSGPVRGGGTVKDRIVQRYKSEKSAQLEAKSLRAWGYTVKIERRP